jgi:hypothetical protein
MVGKAVSAVIKQDHVLDSPKTKLFTFGIFKLANYMACMTTFLHMRDHYVFINYNLSVFWRDKLPNCKTCYLWLEILLVQ